MQLKITAVWPKNHKYETPNSLARVPFKALDFALNELVVYYELSLIHQHQKMNITKVIGLILDKWL